MVKKLYVGNLSYNTTSASLQEVFAAFGEVASVNVVTDRDTGRSRGFAFVEMATDEGAQAAIAGVNGKMVDDRELKVAEARPQADRGGGFGRGGGGRRGGEQRRSRW